MEELVSLTRSIQYDHLVDMHAIQRWLDTEPVRHAVIVGGGYIACEFACILHGLGVEVTQYYRGAQILRGFDDEARDMVLGTIGGAIAMASEPSAPSLEELRNSVTSKGGTTAAGLGALNADGGLSKRLHDTLQAAYDRAVELR